MLVIVLLVNRRIRYSKLGYSLLALGEDEDAVEVLGVNSQASKLKALAIYAFICGVVGGVYACIYGYIHPSFFDTSMSMEIAILGIVGGMGYHLWTSIRRHCHGSVPRAVTSRTGQPVGRALPGRLRGNLDPGSTVPAAWSCPRHRAWV